MKKHPTREILEQGGVVDGEAFDLMLAEEKKEQGEDIMGELKKIKEEINGIKIAVGYVGTYYDDSACRYVLLKVPNNQSD